METKGGRGVVESLYDALSRGDAAAAEAAMAEDVEWWFHGPRRCQYMRRVLTGEADERGGFRFRPRRVTAVGGPWVVAEGWEGKHAYWVHAWAVEHGVITLFREYFNTSLTVISHGQLRGGGAASSTSAVGQMGAGGGALWQSEAPEREGRRSLPGLLLAI
ncbi:wound-induced protein 1-like [Zingiber officinale]|uniref:Wound-induced protein 1 n=1 Tax=Zingiber officinale TaxID=94328 RepID=A0A8J5C5R5_ZINOF|nr:wound-induced protein 1-like [Zingiber officinale]KAG6471843.1 hypothetical protein ZIOFF_069290 [Zingiber officinale]